MRTYPLGGRFTPLTELLRLRRQYVEGPLVAPGRLARPVIFRCVRVDRLSVAAIPKQ